VFRVWFSEFLDRVSVLFLSCSEEDKGRMSFAFYDDDMDGIISASDLMTFVDGMDKYSPLYDEINILITKYMETNVYRKKHNADLIDPGYF
jgi:Ca2+-binding EF-hand superfamily protein